MQTPTPTTESNDVAVNLFPEVDLKVYVRIIWHWAWLIVLCILLAAISAYVTSSLSIPIYQASSTLLIDQASNPVSNMNDLLTSERIARTYAELMQRKKLLARVAESFGIDPLTLEDSLTDISVTPVRDTQLVKVQVEAISPELAAAVADTLPNVFIEEINSIQTQEFDESKVRLEEQLRTIDGQIELTQVALDEFGSSRTAEEELRYAQLRDELAQYQSSYTSVLSRYEDLRLTELQSTDSITIVDEAEIPEEPIRPRVLINTLLAAIVGAMLALGVIFLVEYLDDRIKTPQDLYAVIDAPLLGAIASLPGKRRNKKHATPEQSLIVAHQPRHPVAESYRRLRTNLRFSSVNEPLRILLVTSAAPSEGKTTTAANLAIAVAQAGHKVIIVDADLRKPQLHKLFELGKSPGLTDALLSEAGVGFFVRDTQIPNLRIITSGSIPPNPAELLGSQPMQRLLKALQQEADLVIVDAPPLLAVTDAQVLVNHVQGVLLVVNAGSTSRAMLSSAAAALMQVEARVLGVVLNQLVRSPRSYYYYDAYAGYYAADEEPDAAPVGQTEVGIKPANFNTQVTEAAAPKEEFVLSGTVNGHNNGYYQLNPDSETKA